MTWRRCSDPSYRIYFHRRESRKSDRLELCFPELCDFVELRCSHCQVGFCILLAGYLAKLGVDEEGKQRCGDNIGSDGLFVIFGLPPFSYPYANIGDEHAELWQFRFDSSGKCQDRNV